MAPRTKTMLWPRELQGNAWEACWDTAYATARTVNGSGKAPYVDPRGRSYTDQLYPRITNGQAVTLIMGWMMAAGPRAVNSTFALWYQLAAVAYGWTPERDKLDTSAKRRDAWYPGEVAIELWMQSSALASQLDIAAGGKDAGAILALDGSFDDPTFQAQVAAALRDDGASATWLIPLPACKDPKTGKPTGRPHRDKNGKWTCDPVVIDDPITRAKKSVNGLLVLMLVVGIVVWASDNNEPRRSRRRS